MNIPHEKEQRLRIQLLRQGTEWGGKRRLAAALVTVVLSVFPAAASAGLLPETSASTVSVIVRELAGAGNGPERAVRGAGGRVGRHIAIIDGFVAELPRSAVAGLRTRRDVHSVSENRPVHLNGLDGLDGWDHTHDVGSMVYIAQEVTGAGEYWNDGFTGKGVDVALIDSGVLPVNGLTAPGKVAYGPDLSFDSQADSVRYLATPAAVGDRAGDRRSPPG